jgi:hypothetical protein
VPLIEFMAFLPEQHGILAADEMLGADRRSAVFQTWLYIHQIEARGRHCGLGDVRPLPAESYCFDRYTENRLISPDPSWWTHVEVRFVPPAEPPARRGPRPLEVWEVIRPAVERWMQENHEIVVRRGGQTSVEGIIAEQIHGLADNTEEPASSTIQRYAKTWRNAHLERSRNHR